MISNHRDDGKITAPETVSRWLTGTNPVEAAVIGWLIELLRNKALGMRGAVIEWPASKSIMIAVTNLKGGVGTTTVSHNLAAVSTYDYHLKTRHISVGMRGDTKYAVKELGECGIRAEIMSYESMLSYEAKPHEVVIIDLARDAAYEALESKPDAFLRTFAPDLYLVPADFGDLFQAHSTKQFANIDGLLSGLKFLHRPQFMSMDFSRTANEAGFNVLDDSFCPTFIPQAIARPYYLPRRRFSERPSTDQEHHYIELFNYLVEELGGSLTLPTDTESSIRSMDPESLLDYIEQNR